MWYLLKYTFDTVYLTLLVLEVTMKQCELKVFDDGECAVRKVTQPPSFQTNMMFDSQQELQEYLKSFLGIRWPIREVLDSIESSKDYEWVEFK